MSGVDGAWFETAALELELRLLWPRLEHGNFFAGIGYFNWNFDIGNFLPEFGHLLIWLQWANMGQTYVSLGLFIQTDSIFFFWFSNTRKTSFYLEKIFYFDHRQRPFNINFFFFWQSQKKSRTWPGLKSIRKRRQCFLLSQIWCKIYGEEICKTLT